MVANLKKVNKFRRCVTKAFKTYVTKKAGIKSPNINMTSLIGIIVIAKGKVFQKLHLCASSLVLEWYSASLSLSTILIFSVIFQARINKVPPKTALSKSKILIVNQLGHKQHSRLI